MKKYLLNFILSNEKSIKVFLFCLILGLASGILCFNYINEASQNTLVSSFKDTIEISKSENFEKVQIISNGIKSILFTIIIFLLVSFILIAPIIMCIIYFIKGLSIGLLISIIFNIFTFTNSIFTTLLIVIIPNLIYIPIMLFIGIKTTDFHYMITEKNTKKEGIKSFIALSYSYLLSLPFFFLSIVLEQILFPIVISMYV